MAAGVALVALAGCLAATASADGDPASDYLISQSIFAPLDPNVPHAGADELARLIADADTGGFPIKVALIGRRTDLGAVTALWRQPQRYAEFLGQELVYIHRGPLLIVMPNGYGISRRGKPFAADRRILDRIPVPPGGFASLPAAGLEAVRKLAGARGIRLAAPAPPPDHGTRDRLELLAIAAAVIAVGALAFVPRRRRRRSGEEC